jgi:hypothetical protein
MLEGELACEQEDRIRWVVGKNVYASLIDITYKRSGGAVAYQYARYKHCLGETITVSPMYPLQRKSDCQQRLDPLGKGCCGRERMHGCVRKHGVWCTGVQC